MSQGGMGNNMGDPAGVNGFNRRGPIAPNMGDPRGVNGFGRNGPIQPGTTTTPGNSGFGSQANNAGWMDSMRAQSPATLAAPTTPTNGLPNLTGGLSPADQFGNPAIQNQTSGSQLPGVIGADGQRYADRNSSPRAYTGGAFNPAANQWGDYSQRQGDGLFGTDANGINRFNGHVFAPSGLNSGNNDFANFLGRFAPQFQRQNGPINLGTAQTWGAPQGVLQGSRGTPTAFNPWGTSQPGSGLNRGNGPQFDPRTGNPGGTRVNRTDDAGRTGAKPPPPTFAPWNIRNPFLK